jgi:hypothetical protein
VVEVVEKLEVVQEELEDLVVEVEDQVEQELLVILLQ